MSVEQKMEQMANVIRAMEEQLENMIRNEEALNRTRNSIHAASESVRQIKNKEQESDTLLSIGGGVFVPTKVSSSNKMLLEIGSGVAIEKDLNYILNYLENRIREIDMAIKNTSAEKQNLIGHIEQYRAQLNQTMHTIYGGQAQQGPSGNV